MGFNQLFDHSSIPPPTPPLPLPPGECFRNRWTNFDENWYISSLGMYEWVATKIFYSFLSRPPFAPSTPPPLKGVFGTSGPISMKFCMYHPWVCMNGFQPIIQQSPHSAPHPPKKVFGTGGPISMKIGIYHPWVCMNGLQLKFFDYFPSPPSAPTLPPPS